MERFTDLLKFNTVKTKLTLVFGAFYLIFVAVFLVLSIPVYIYRQFVILLATCFRPELEIMSGQSALFAADFFADTNPRSNVVVALTFQGQLTLEQVQKRVFKNYICQTGRLTDLENYQRVPVQWLGFVFWKNAAQSFSLSDHVYKYSGGGGDTKVTDAQMTRIIEYFLNKKLPTSQSPWEIILIDNYDNPYLKTDTAPGQDNQLYSMLLFKWHHCLCDGVGSATALVEGFFEERCWNGKPVLPRQKTSAFQQVKQALELPFNLIYCFSHIFRSDPLKVPDNKKHGYQVYAKSGLVAVQLIKDIKNKFKVCYASVLLSAISVAVHKTLQAKENNNNNSSSGDAAASTLCLTVLPAIGTTKRKTLTNLMTGALFDLPTTSFECPVERLRYVNRLMEKSKTSAIPLLLQHVTSLLGANSYMLSHIVANNKMIPIGLSNFVPLPENLKVDDTKKLLHLQTAAGGHQGETGIVISVSGLAQWMEIFITAESSIMTKEQAEKFLEYVKAEIESLRVAMFDSTC